jgi:predicted transcriptional regulator
MLIWRAFPWIIRKCSRFAQYFGVSIYADYTAAELKEISVSVAKEAMIDIIGRQPDDSTYDELLRELAFARMVQRGLDDSDAGRTLSNDDVKRKIDSWQK